MPTYCHNDNALSNAQPQQLPRLTQEQAEVLAIVVMDGMANVTTLEELGIGDGSAAV
jgi:hypothetical protein